MQLPTEVISTYPSVSRSSTMGKLCSQSTLLPGAIANSCHLGTSSSNMLPGYFRILEKANYNVVLLVSGVYCLLFHRQLIFPSFGLFKPNPTEQMEGNLN